MKRLQSVLVIFVYMGIACVRLIAQQPDDLDRKSVFIHTRVGKGSVAVIKSKATPSDLERIPEDVVGLRFVGTSTKISDYSQLQRLFRVRSVWIYSTEHADQIIEDLCNNDIRLVYSSSRHLTKRGVEAIGRFRKLESISLKNIDQNLQGVDFSGLVDLRDAKLSYVSTPTPLLQSMNSDSLESLEVRAPIVDSRLLDSLTRFSNLESLTIGLNESLEDKIEDSIQLDRFTPKTQLSRLRKLESQSIPLEEVLKLIDSSSPVQEVNIRGECNATDTLRKLSFWSHLKRITIDTSCGQEPIDYSLGIPEGNHIEELVLRDPELSDDSFSLLPAMPDLVLLNLTNTSVQGVSQFVNRCPKLQTVRIPRISDAEVPALRNLRNLRELEGDLLNVSDAHVCKFLSIPNFVLRNWNPAVQIRSIDDFQKAKKRRLKKPCKNGDSQSG